MLYEFQLPNKFLATKLLQIVIRNSNYFWLLLGNKNKWFKNGKNDVFS